MLIGTSILLENKFEVEGLAISPDEATSFLTAAQNVARHYSIETTQRTLDWVAFVGVTAQVFGTRAIAVVVTKSGRKSRRPSGPPADVVNTDGTRYVPSVVPGTYDDAP